MSREGSEAGRSEFWGAVSTICAFVAWGILPVYWKALAHIPPHQILAFRIVWTFVAVSVCVAIAGRFQEVRLLVRSPRSLLEACGASCALGANWYTFIYAVNTGHVMDCSLGYYINPLVNVLLGFLFLGERFRPVQKAAVVLAFLGVLNATIAFGRFPAIALILAGTFGTYGLLRKKAGYEAVPGVFFETAFLSVPALLYLLASGSRILQAATAAGLLRAFLVPGAGVVTAVPLVLFTYGARRIRLATVGFIQYLTPTGMFLLGVLAYKEPFGGPQLLTFAFIWAAVALYLWDVVRNRSLSPSG